MGIKLGVCGAGLVGVTGAAAGAPPFCDMREQCDYWKKEARPLLVALRKLWNETSGFCLVSCLPSSRYPI